LFVFETEPKDTELHSRRENEPEQSVAFIEIFHSMRSALDGGFTDIRFLKGILKRPKITPE
jgi:hypothetical protein